MKVNFKPIDNGVFIPFTLSITVESKAEHKALFNIFNVSYNNIYSNSPRFNDETTKKVHNDVVMSIFILLFDEARKRGLIK